MSGVSATGPVRVTRSRHPRPALALIGLAVVAGLAALPLAFDAGTTSTLVDMFTLLTMATMWNLLAGYAGLVSIGQQAWVGLGAYTVLVLAQLGVPPYLAVPMAAVVCAATALPLSWFLFRLRGGYFAIATWVVADTIRLAVNTRKELGGGTGAILPGIAGVDPATRLAWTYWVALAVTVVAVGVAYALLRGRLGLVLTAIRDNEVGARSVGADVRAAKRTVFLVSAAGTGLAGTLLILSQLNVQAASVFSVGWSAKIIFIAVIGGMGSIEGPIIGTGLYFLLQQLLAQYGAWYFVTLGVVAIVIALWAPRGLWGLIGDRIRVRAFPVGYWLWDRDEPPDDAAPAGPGGR